MGCDKNMLGMIMVMGRLNRSSLMIYGGIIRFGYFVVDGGIFDIVFVF